MDERSAMNDQEKQTDERVAILTGERICASCGFNLHGSPITREHHYNMLIARCPECGTVASLQEYPLLGRWATRWGRVLAAIWLMLPILWFMIAVSMMDARARMISYKACAPYGMEIAKAFSPYYRENRDSYGGYWQGNYDEWFLDDDSVFGSGVAVDGTWWMNERDNLQPFIAMASWINQYNWKSLYSLWDGLIPLCIVGMVWAIIIPGKRYVVSLIIALLVVSLAVYASASYYEGFLVGLVTRNYYAYNTVSGYTNANQIAYMEVSLPIRIIVTTLLTIPLLIGMIYGRIAARCLVIALLPPHARGWLAFLWINDGKQPPTKTWIDR